MVTDTTIKKGYKKTEVGVIPEDWEVKSIEQLCVPDGLVRGPFGGSLKKEFFVESGIKVYEQKNAIYRDKDRGTYYIDNSKFIELKRFEVKEGDFIVSCSGTIGRIFKIPKNSEKGIINQALLKIEIDESIVDDQYFYCYFDWEKFQERIIDNTQGGAMKNLVGMSIFRNTAIPLPPTKAEQTAISTALKDTNALISSLEEIISKKKNIKQGAMQELLTGKKRLPGFNEQWEAEKLGKIAGITKGQGLSKGKISDSGEYYCILYGELFTTYKEEITTVQSKTDFNEGRLSKYGDVLIPGSTTTTGIDLAKASALLMNNVLLGGDINIIRNLYDFYNPVFLAYYLTHICKNKIAQRAKGITIYHLHGKDIMDLEIIMPKKEEQFAIAQVLSDMDAEIEELEQKLDKYQMIKQGMMQELLTGKTRLI